LLKTCFSNISGTAQYGKLKLSRHDERDVQLPKRQNVYAAATAITTITTTATTTTLIATNSKDIEAKI
jgi:hypothetical protein